MCRSPVILPPVVIRGTAVVVVLVAAALAGCNAEADPTPLPPLPSVSPTPETLQVPPEATPATAQGAAAFARYFFGRVNNSLISGDASGIRLLSEGDCAGCINLIDAAESPPKEGERVEGGLFDIMFAEASPVEGEDVLVDVRYVVTALRVLAPDGTLLRSKPATQPIDAQVRLTRKSTGWFVREFRNLT
jgi:hypothetical protein